jgi:hypothetical protein
MYYLVVSIIAVVLLVILLTIFGLMMTNNNKKAFPEFKNLCPDSWKHELVTENGTTLHKCTPPTSNNNPVLGWKAWRNQVLPNSIPKDGAQVTKDTNTKKITEIKYDDTAWEKCKLTKWIKTNNILWDGVSNSNECN